MEATQIIGAEKRKLDLEKLKLEIQQDTDRVIRDTIKPVIDVNDYLDQDQRTAVSSGQHQGFTHSQMGSPHMYGNTNQETQSLLYPGSLGHHSELITPQMDRGLSRSTWNDSLHATFGSSRLDSQHTMVGRPESVRHHLYNHSRNPFAAQHYSHVGSQQHLHLPTPIYHTNPFSILQEMVPMPSPSGLSSNIHIPETHIEAGLTESNLRSPPRSLINSSLQAHVESAFGSEAGGDSSSFQQRAAKAQMSSSIGRSWSPPCRPPHLDRIHVHDGTPTNPSLAKNSRAPEDSNSMPRTRVRDFSMTLSADTPPSAPNPDAFPAPTPPRVASIGGSPARLTSINGSPLPSRSVPSSFDGYHYHTERAYKSPVAQSEPNRNEARSSREFTEREESRPVSGASQNHHVPQLRG
ncbi:hypothetical protein PG994_004199 [Apiospora phragmitis]|uniref:Uncharacterized protein n=1 Tax=Apiospora phragmitis TaxID=2905665 RepID=A0ABR1VPX8_9PEZI